jgi:hypothetical protein
MNDETRMNKVVEESNEERIAAERRSAIARRPVFIFANR